MQFRSDAPTYKAVNITGPTHNFLGVEFLPPDAAAEAVLVEPIQLQAAEPIRLAADDVERWALEGIREANEELGTAYRLRRITFVVSDSPPAQVYREMAKRIALRLHAQPTAFDGVEG